MLVAMRDGRRVFAEQTGDRAICPDCGDELIAKVGQIVEAHWAHRSESACSGGGGPEGEFHRRWKMLIGGYDPERIEVRVERHRADAIDASGRIVEIQCSSISAADIESREATYGERLIWLAPDRRLANRVRAPLIVIDETSDLASCRGRVITIGDFQAAIPKHGVLGPVWSTSKVVNPAHSEPQRTSANYRQAELPAYIPPKRSIYGVVELIDDCNADGTVVPAGTRLWGYAGGIVWHGGHVACRVRAVGDA